MLTCAKWWCCCWWTILNCILCKNAHFYSCYLMVKRQPKPANHQFSVHGIVGDWYERECGEFAWKLPLLKKALQYSSGTLARDGRFLPHKSVDNVKGQKGGYRKTLCVKMRFLSFVCVSPCGQSISLAKLPFPLKIVFDILSYMYSIPCK